MSDRGVTQNDTFYANYETINIKLHWQLFHIANYNNVLTIINKIL